MSEPMANAGVDCQQEQAPFPLWPVAVAAILAAACALCLPAYSGPDELGHLAYAAALAQGHLPIIPVGEFADIASGATWQGQHPPLFYLPAALVYLAAGRNPVLSLYLIRILCAAGLVVTVWLTNRIAVTLLPRDSANVATWIVAAHPTVVYVAAMVNNEAWAMATACVWSAVNANSVSPADPKRERLWLAAAVALGGLRLHRLFLYNRAFQRHLVEKVGGLPSLRSNCTIYRDGYNRYN